MNTEPQSENQSPVEATTAPVADRKNSIISKRVGVVTVEMLIATAPNAKSVSHLAEVLGVVEPGQRVSGSFIKRVLLLVPDIKSRLMKPAVASPEIEVLPEPEVEPEPTEPTSSDTKKKVGKVESYKLQKTTFGQLDWGNRFVFRNVLYAMKWDEETMWVPTSNEYAKVAAATKVVKISGDLSAYVRKHSSAFDVFYEGKTISTADLIESDMFQGRQKIPA